MADEYTPVGMTGASELPDDGDVEQQVGDMGQIADDESYADEFEPQELRRLVDELQQLVVRLEGVYEEVPQERPARFGRLRKFLFEYPAEMTASTIMQVRSGIGSDIFDADTWKGIGYVINYMLQTQADFVRRRLRGDYETDEWGVDQEVIDAIMPFFNFLYNTYWRVSVNGIENIPEEGRALLVCNHSGQLPWDGSMVTAAVLNEHPNPRLLHTLYADYFPRVPFLSTILTKSGQTLANDENARRLLECDELVAVFPEGIKGISKTYRERYQLARFGRGGFTRIALSTDAPIIPVSIVGAEETYITLAQSRTIARLLGLPVFPITFRWPLLGPLAFIPLPTKWYIDFGEPVQVEQSKIEDMDNTMLVSQLTDQIRNTIQDMIYTRLAQRNSIFFG